MATPSASYSLTIRVVVPSAPGSFARVAAARKLAEICWKRLVSWERQHHPEVAVA